MKASSDTHQWHWLRRNPPESNADGGVLVDTRPGPSSAPPLALWGEPLPPHWLENVGAVPLHVISTELKGRTDSF